jgi:hypothetical protein
MGYQTGVSTGPNDLLDKLRLFLISEGWNVNLWTTVGAGYRLHVDKVTSSSGVQMYFNFRSAISETGSTLITEDNNGGANGTVTGIIINGSTGYDVGQDWDTQPGYSYNPYDNNYGYGGVMTQMSTSAIPAYYFFTVGDSVHICVEVTSGQFQFTSFGCLLKQGTYDGGMYFSASWPSVYPYGDWSLGLYGPRYFTHNIGGSYGSISGGVYLDVDSIARWRTTDAETLREILMPCVAGQSVNGLYSTSALASHFWKKSPNSYNNIAAMCPIYVSGKRSDNNYSLLGWPEGVRFLNVTNYSAGQELTYGTETWKVFHADSADFTPSNMYAGFAFKKEL